MPIPPDNISKLYAVLKQHNFDVPESEDLFRSKIEDRNNASLLHDAMRRNNFEVPEFKNFYDTLFPQKKSPDQAGSPPAKTFFAGSSAEQAKRLGYDQMASPLDEQLVNKVNDRPGMVTQPWAGPLKDAYPQIKVSRDEVPQEQTDKMLARLLNNDNGISRPLSALNTAEQSLVRPFTQALKSVGMIADEGYGLKFSPMFNAVSDFVEKQTKELLPNNPAYQDEFLTTRLPEALGTLGAYILGGSVGRTTRVAEMGSSSFAKGMLKNAADNVPMAFMASASGAADQYDAALASGADENTAFKAWELGMSEGIPFLLTPTINAFNATTNSTLKSINAIKGAAQNGAIGFFQMGASKALENLSAQQTYDKTREIADGVLAAGGSGFAIAAALGGLHGALAETRKPISPDAITYVKVKLKQLSDNNIHYTDYYKEGSKPMEMVEENGVWVAKDEKMRGTEKTNPNTEKANSQLLEKENLGVKSPAIEQKGTENLTENKQDKMVTLYRGVSRQEDVDSAIKNQNVDFLGKRDVSTYFTEDYDYALRYANGDPQRVLKITVPESELKNGFKDGTWHFDPQDASIYTAPGKGYKGSVEVAKNPNITSSTTNKSEEVVRNDEQSPSKSNHVPIPKGWTKAIGGISKENGVRPAGEVDWKNKRIMFSSVENSNNPEIVNHEVAHIIVEELPESIRNKILDNYVDIVKSEMYTQKGFEPEWIKKNNFHREDIAIDYGMYLSDDPGLDKKIAEFFDSQPELSKLKPNEPSPAVEDQSVATVEQNIAIDKSDVTAPGKQLFSPPNPGTKKVATIYKAKNRITEPEGQPITSIDEKNSMAIADEFAKMEHNPEDPIVKSAYEAMAKQTMEQAREVMDSGVSVEIFQGEGEPYKNSAEMIKDVRDNNHLFILSTEKDFWTTKITDKQRAENPLLRDSGQKDVNGKTLLVNDLFRFVHDYFGHTERGNSFGPVGEENAWDVHARMFTPLARRAVTTETRGQNSWVNFGPKMRNAAGEIIKKGEAGYLSPKERPYAEQKIGLMPEWTSNLLVNGRTVKPEQNVTNTPEKGNEPVTSGEPKPGDMIAYESASGAEIKTGEFIGMKGDKYQVKDRRGHTYTFPKNKFIREPEYTADQPVKLSKSIEDIADRYESQNKGGIVPLSFNPITIVSKIYGLLTRAQEAFFGNMLAKPAENWIAKQVRKGVTNRNYAVRSATNLMRNIIGGLPYSQQGIKDKLSFFGMKNWAGLRAKILSDEWYSIVDSDKTALQRVHSALDPDFYRQKNAQPGAKQYPVVNYGKLNSSERALYDALRSMNDFIHEWSWRNKFIDKDTYLKYKGKYIGRFYEEIEFRPKEEREQQSSRAEFGMYNRRKENDLSVLEDPVYATARRLSQIMRNQAIFDYAEALVKAKEIQHSPVEFPGSVKLGIGPSGQPYYGVLSGEYVPGYIAEDFKGFSFMNEGMQKTYEILQKYDSWEVRQFLKKANTVWNPQVGVGNFTNNFTFAFLAGIDPVTFTVNMTRAMDFKIQNGRITSGKNRTPEYIELTKTGLMGADMASNELLPGRVKPRTGLMGLWDRFDNTTKALYSGTDDVAKIAAYITFREQGYSSEKAVEKVMESFQNYSLVGKAYDFASKTPIFGNPYIKFKADLGRILKNSMTRRPLNALMFVAGLYMTAGWLSQAAKESDLTRRIREARSYVPKLKLPKLTIPLTWQVPGIGEVNAARYITPLYTYDKGEANTWLGETTDWLPYQFDWDTPIKKAQDVLPWPELPDVLLGTYLQVYFDRDFRGKSIMDPEGTRFKDVAFSKSERLKNALFYISRAQVPLFARAQDMMAAYEGEPDFYNRTRSFPQAILNNVIKVQQFGDEEAKKWITKQVEGKYNQLGYIVRDISAAKTQYIKDLGDIESNTHMTPAAKDKFKIEAFKRWEDRYATKMEEHAEVLKQMEEPLELMQELEQKFPDYKGPR